MTMVAPIAPAVRRRIFEWAARRREQIMVSLNQGGEWVLLRSELVGCDDARDVLCISDPEPTIGCRSSVLAPGVAVGVSFRRGHKKCVFSTVVAGRTTGDDGRPYVLLAVPDHMQEIQRRAYQRTPIDVDLQIVVCVWSGEIDEKARESVNPMCIGLLRDLSAGGMQIEVEADQNPSLRVGDRIWLEATISSRESPLLVSAVYRHAAMNGPTRVGLGFQFVGLESTESGRATLDRLARFVAELRQPSYPDVGGDPEAHPSVRGFPSRAKAGAGRKRSAEPVCADDDVD